VIESTGEYLDSPSSLLLDEELDQFSSPYLVNHTSTSLDFLNIVLISDESIMEVMILQDKPQECSHHQSSFLPFAEKKKTQKQTLVSIDIQDRSLLHSTS
jgi:hypothetical protein